MDNQYENNLTNELCDKGHTSQERACKQCYDELFKKYNAIINKNGKTSKQKSFWHTW